MTSFCDVIIKISGDPAPQVILVEEKSPDEDSSAIEQNITQPVNSFDEKLPRLYAIQRAETEGKNVIKHIISIQIKNWHFRSADAKVLSHCLV